MAWWFATVKPLLKQLYCLIHPVTVYQQRMKKVGFIFVCETRGVLTSKVGVFLHQTLDQAFVWEIGTGLNQTFGLEDHLTRALKQLLKRFMEELGVVISKHPPKRRLLSL